MDLGKEPEPKKWKANSDDDDVDDDIVADVKEKSYKGRKKRSTKDIIEEESDAEEK